MPSLVGAQQYTPTFAAASFGNIPGAICMNSHSSSSLHSTTKLCRMYDNLIHTCSALLQGCVLQSLCPFVTTQLIVGRPSTLSRPAFSQWRSSVNTIIPAWSNWFTGLRVNWVLALHCVRPFGISYKRAWPSVLLMGGS